MKPGLSSTCAEPSGQSSDQVPLQVPHHPAEFSGINLVAVHLDDVNATVHQQGRLNGLEEPFQQVVVHAPMALLSVVAQFSRPHNSGVSHREGA